MYLWKLVRETLNWNCPPWPSTMITTCMSYLAKRGPEHGAATENSPGEFGRGHKEGSNTSPHVLPTSQNPSCWDPSLLRDAWATSKDHELDQMCAKWGDWPETPGNQSHYHNPWDCESCSRGVLLGFIILPGYPFPLKGVSLVYTCYGVHLLCQPVSLLRQFVSTC